MLDLGFAEPLMRNTRDQPPSQIYRKAAMWQPIETATPGELLLYFPPEERDGKIVLSEMVRAEVYPVSYPRKPSHWMSIPPLPKAPARDYRKMFSEGG